jgi:hypothetical protein
LLTFDPERQRYAREAPHDVDLRRRAVGHLLTIVDDRFRAGYPAPIRASHVNAKRITG